MAERSDEPLEDPEPGRPHSGGEVLARARALLSSRWLNSPPLLVASPADEGASHLNFIDPALAQRAILLEFWDYTCFHCLRTLPYLRAWHERYAPLGLTIIGVHTPKFSFGGDRRYVEGAVRDLGIRYPVVIDADYAIWRALGNERWPRMILLDRTGQAVFDHAGEGAYLELEAKLQNALRRGHPGLPLPAPIAPVRPADAPGAVLHPTTPELYCGSLRGTVGNREGLDPNRGVVDYADETRRAADTLYLAGRWQATRESLRAAPAPGRPAALKLRCQAAGVNAVLRGFLPGPVFARVTLDGRPVPEARRGADLKAGNGGETAVEAGEPGMAQLVGGTEHRKLELVLEVESGDLEVFAFSFASSVRVELGPRP